MTNTELISSNKYIKDGNISTDKRAVNQMRVKCMLHGIHKYIHRTNHDPTVPSNYKEYALC